MLAVVMVGCMGMLRPDKPHGISPKRFWSLKIQAKNCADIVLGGDSRTFCSLSPTHMNEVLPDCRIFNFAFGGNGYFSTYCQKLEEVLRSDAPSPKIVLGITPASLCLRAFRRNGFREHLAMPQQDKWIRCHFGHIYDFFDPMSFGDAWQGLFPQFGKDRNYREYHEDGWVGADSEPVSYKSELRRYRRRFEESSISEDMVNDLLAQIRQWAEKGIRVYGFRPPVPAEMLELEETMSGFEEENFVRRFETAGGEWIDMPPVTSASHDGSHLRLNAAVQFSKDFATMLNLSMQ